MTWTPLFGHAGKRAIQNWFKSIRTNSPFVNFEGSQQGFRMLVDSRKFNLTCAAVGAYIKYPPDWHEKKTSVWSFDRAHYESIAMALQLPASGVTVRHPLAYLVEAADDICNALLDLEDGIRVGILGYQDLADLTRGLMPPSFESASTDDIRTDPVEQAGRLRAYAISALRRRAADSFQKEYVEIMAGERIAGLMDHDPFCESAKQIAKEKCYRHKSVLISELAGRGAIEEILSALLGDENKEDFQQRMLQATELRSSLITGVTGVDFEEKVVEFVMGMTDSFAMRLYHQLLGVDVPGGF
jgi:dGTPase